MCKGQIVTSIFNFLFTTHASFCSDVDGDHAPYRKMLTSSNKGNKNKQNRQLRTILFNFFCSTDQNYIHFMCTYKLRKLNWTACLVTTFELPILLELIISINIYGQWIFVLVNVNKSNVKYCFFLFLWIESTDYEKYVCNQNGVWWEKHSMFTICCTTNDTVLQKCSVTHSFFRQPNPTPCFFLNIFSPTFM